jgi:transcriptional regulator of acetoin/glycerol metabolism
MELLNQMPMYASLEKLPLLRAKAELMAWFERHYVERLLKETQGNVTEAARRAEVDRVTMFRIIRRCGLRDKPVECSLEPDR